MERLCIYPKDIMVITGRSDRYGRKLIKKIKEYFSKKQHQVVAIDEFLINDFLVIFFPIMSVEVTEVMH
ncbi:MAG: hypothetical protein J0H55_12155 [Chitinophagaceae bacterium]|nr:hypothetical protein [Chitinophagaceae bacterium]